VVICLERGADLHTALLMPLPLPLTFSYLSKIEIGFTFWYRFTRVVTDRGPLNRCVCVCVCVWNQTSVGKVSVKKLRTESVTSCLQLSRRRCA